MFEVDESSLKHTYGSELLLCKSFVVLEFYSICVEFEFYTFGNAAREDRTSTARSAGEICSSLTLLQGDIFWQKNKSFDKKPTFVCILKKPNWVTAEWCWRLRFESTVKYFVKISRNNNKISHCALRCSAIKQIQRYSIWLLSNTNKWRLFFKRFVFCLKTSSWSTVKEEQISSVDRAVLTMLSLELAGWFYATVFMAQSIGASIIFSK